VREPFMNGDEQRKEKLRGQGPDFRGEPNHHTLKPVASTGAAGSNALPGTVELRVEELVLHGFAPSDRYLIAEAIERELARLLAEEGVPPSLAREGEAAMLDAGEFHAARGSRPEAIGAQVARVIYGGFK